MSFDFLPQWILAAGAPALSVIAFFWKGDDALSQDFRKWLTQKILQVKLTVPDISSIEPLGKVFDFIYGRRYFALSTFLRVSAISTIALVVICFLFATDPRLTSVLWLAIKAHPLISILACVMNIIFDYLSVTKSRFLIERIAKFRTKYNVVIFICADLITTFLVVWPAYRSATEFLPIDPKFSYEQGWLFDPRYSSSLLKNPRKPSRSRCLAGFSVCLQVGFFGCVQAPRLRRL